jgi:hypothetical protein
MDGWVYVLTNDSMPGLVKIGHSTKDPAIRSSELYQTGTPTPFIVQYSALVNNPQSVEFAAHKLLRQQRVNPNREFFRCSVWDAVKAIESISEPITVHNHAADIEEERDRQERKHIRENFIKREIQPLVDWQKIELDKLKKQKEQMLDVPYLFHFYAWIFITGALSGLPSLASSDLLLVIILFGGPYLTQQVHKSKIENSDKFKKFDAMARSINEKVSAAMLKLEREAEDEWGDL